MARLDEKIALVTGARRLATLPTGRRNQPEDIAAMAAFLASADADNITGQAYNVDGGAVMIA